MSAATEISADFVIVKIRSIIRLIFFLFMKLILNLHLHISQISPFSGLNLLFNGKPSLSIIHSPISHLHLPHLHHSLPMPVSRKRAVLRLQSTFRMRNKTGQCRVSFLGKQQANVLRAGGVRGPVPVKPADCHGC